MSELLQDWREKEAKVRELRATDDKQRGVMRILAFAIVAVMLVWVGYIAAVYVNFSEDLGSPTIPQCISDDFNDGTQSLCYTTRVTDGAIIVIDSTDTVVSVDAP
jgi:hypothetical protein